MASTEARKRRNYAVLSKIAYEKNDPRHVRDSLKSYNLDRIIRFLPGMSDDNRKTFYNAKTDKVIIAYRGTQPTNVSDLTADTAIFFGVERASPRFNEALRHAKAVERAAGKGRVEVTGHSLGGSEALYVSENTGIPSVTYNPGKTFQQFDLLGRYKQLRDLIDPSANKSNPANSKVYSTHFDPVSFSADRTNANVEYLWPCGYNVHAVDNFIDA